MLKQATYSNGTQAATVRLERIDVLLKSEAEVLCFPRLIELEGDRLVLVYLKKWHEQGGQKEAPQRRGRLRVSAHRVRLRPPDISRRSHPT